MSAPDKRTPEVHEFSHPTREGWWWVCTASCENLDGFQPVWVSDRDPSPEVSDLVFDEGGS